MANKVPKFTISQHKQARNAFDLSQSHLIQAAPGQLLPILSIDCIPEDNISINVVDTLKSMPIVNSPLVNARGVYEFFFVPYHQLYHNFDQFITKMNDYRSTYFNQPNPPAAVPTFGTTTPPDNSKAFLGSPFANSKGVINGFLDSKDVFGHSTLCSRSYLYDLLGYSPFAKDTSSWTKFVGIPEHSPNYKPNLFRLAAYQKIYQDYYRKTSYEPFEVQSYCLDNIYPDQYPSMAELRYRNYGLDLLNNLRPSASLNVNNQSVFDSIVPQMFGTDGNNDFPSSASYAPMSYVGKSDTFGTIIDNQDNGGINVNSIRAAFALDKLSQIIGRAEKDFKSQMRAVYGINVSTGRDGKCIFVDGFSSDLNFTDIDNTNGASMGSSFSTYSKVTSNGRGTIRFKAPEFGVFMCIFSIIPFVPYDSYHVDRFNTKSVYSDYFNPLYQRLGLQPLYMYELNTYTDNADVRPMEIALGWQPRYSEYKTAVDFNHGSFNSDSSLASFTSSRNRNLGTPKDKPYLGALTLADFKVNPNVFDSCFSVSYDGSLVTAPFFGKVSFNIVKVSAMDTDSLPLI